jgi:hypothetical protein
MFCNFFSCISPNAQKIFKNKPNSEYLFLWLQRIAIVANIRIDHKESEEKLFKFIYFFCVNNTAILYYLIEIII